MKKANVKLLRPFFVQSHGRQESKMDPSHRIDKITAETVQQLLKEYPTVVADKLHALDESRYATVPNALASRADAHLTKAEVTTLIDWKLSHGTFRPTLKKLVAQNGDDDVEIATRDAFATFAQDSKTNVKAVSALTFFRP